MADNGALSRWVRRNPQQEQEPPSDRAFTPAAPVRPRPNSVPGDRVQEYLARLLVSAALPQFRDGVLDLACGAGYVLLEVAARVGSPGRIVGIDTTSEAIEPSRQWQRIASLRRAELYVMDHQHLDFPSDTFTMVTCNTGLPRLNDPAATLREAHRVLSAGGWLALTVPHAESGDALRATLARRAGALPALPAPGAQPAAGWDETAVANVLTGAGFATVHIQVLREVAWYLDATQWWQSGPGPALPPPSDAILRALEALQPVAATGFDAPLVTIVAIARKGSSPG